MSKAIKGGHLEVSYRPRKASLVAGVIIATLAVLPFVGSARAATTTTKTVFVSEDTYTSQTNNVTHGTTNYLGVNAPAAERRAYVKFSVSGLPTGAVVTSAQLQLYSNSTSTASFTARAVSSTWSASTMTWSNQPALGATLSSRTGLTKSTYNSFGITGYITSNGTYSVGITSAGTAEVLLGSMETGAAVTPKLVLVYSVPLSTTTTVKPTTTTVKSTTTTVAPKSGICGLTSAAPGSYKHVIWIWMENKGYSQVIGSPSAPYENQLAAQCARASNYSDDSTHPSLPNYITATSGATQGVTDDNSPASHPLTADNLFRQVRSTGRTAKSYQEDMPTNCALTSGGLYAVKHNPAAYYQGGSDRAACQTDDVNYSNLSTELANNTLPAFSFITPNLCNDSHDCAVSSGDSWLSTNLPKIFNSATYKSGTTAVFLAWDEGAGSADPDRMPFLVMAPSVRPGTVVSVPLDHPSMLRTTEHLLGINSYLGRAATATDFASAFHL